MTNNLPPASAGQNPGSKQPAGMEPQRRQASAELQQLLGGRCEPDPAPITDERQLFGAKPLCLVRPNSTAEVAQVLAVANRHQVPVVPLGGNTGLCAGAVPEPAGQCIALSLAGLRQVRNCDVANASITAEAGLTVAEVAAATDQHGLYFPLRFGADATAQLGGAIATNAGGSSVLRYGNTRDLVLGLEVVLADGQVLSQLAGLRKNNTGYDLKQLFIGSEGTLGVCTAATLQLFPQLKHRQVALVEVASLSQAVEFCQLARGVAGDLLLALEWLSAQAVAVSKGSVAAGSAAGAAAPGAAPGVAPDLVLCELASSRADEPTQRMQDLLAKATQSGLVAEARVATSRSDAEKMWSLREAIPQGEKQLGGSLKHDVAVTISDLPGFIAAACQAVSEAAAASAAEVSFCLYGHIGDGNIHFNLLLPEPATRSQPAETGPHASLSQAVYDTVAQYNGSFSAEHGVGLLHTQTASRYQDPLALELMRQLKATLDPNNILNPGKVIPGKAIPGKAIPA